MKILITGGNGYIGSSLFDNLKHAYQVKKISRDEPLVEPLDEDEDTDEWGALPSFLRKKKENK